MAETPDVADRADAHRQVEDRLLLDLLAGLGQRQRAAVVLRYWADLSVAQTARLLACEPASVTSQTTRALTTLRHGLRRQPERGSAALSG